MTKDAVVDEPLIAHQEAPDSDNTNPNILPTKRSAEYSTENYKLELTNLPNKVNFHVVKNILERNFKLNPHKIKLGQGKAYISFRSEIERDDALRALNQQEWKGRTLFAQSAKPRDDLVAKKRKTLDETKATDIEDDDQPSLSEDSINEKVCPFWNTDYDKQIEYKEQFIRSVLNISKQVIKLSPNLKKDDPALFDWAKNNDKLCCKFDGVVRSSVLKGYRNKCEFNVGHDGEVGFMIGRYKTGSDLIRPPPRNSPILTEKMFDILDHFRSHLKEDTTFRGFDLLTHEGNYRQITIRRNQKEEYLVIADMHPQNATESEIDSEIDKVVKQLKKIPEVVSIFFNISNRSSYNVSKQSLRLVYGAEALIEYLNIEPERPLKFRIGPASFFQVNTSAAEELYRSIIDLADLNEKSFILDVGCGTGTIGLSLANKVNHVIGIEIVPEAIEDAKINASENKIENVTFYSGRAENLIGESLKIIRNKMDFQNIEDGEIVAIVDPPRVGFNNSFVKTLRASNIKKLIYVACDPKANTNLITLCRPKSKAYQGEPFVPVRAKAFDLFPYTKFCELVVVYKRLSLV